MPSRSAGADLAAHPDRCMSTAAAGRLRVIFATLLAAFAVAVVLLVTTPTATATPASPAATRTNTPAAAEDPDPDPDAGPNLVSLVSAEIGPGGRARPGAFATVRLRLRLNDAEGARNVVARIHIDDVDGDTALWERLITLTSGVEQNAFLYFPLPWGAASNEPVRLTIHDADDAGQATRLIGSGRIALPELADADSTFIGVIGDPDAGLEQYELRAPRRQNETIAASNVNFEVIRGLTPRGLPDRWFGLDAFTTLVWTEGEPARLSTARAQALAEWVRRGGHLVVVVPTFADVWLDPDANPIYDLLPDVDFVRDDDASLEPYRNLLTRPGYDSIPLPTGQTVFAFEPRPGADPDDAACLIEGFDGCVVTRRHVNAGMVTLVGLPVADRQIQVNQQFRADVFWHRLLGYRFDVPSPRMLDANNQRLLSELRIAGSLLETPNYIDDEISNRIARAGTAAAGLLLALSVFIIYWLIAGPLGFFILRQRGAEKHAWVGFVIATAAFAAVAWIGARAISPGSASVAHVTVIDQVYGSPDEHVRSWGSVLMPTYGDRTVIADYPDRQADNNNLLYPFAAPTEDNLLTFPDARAYVADVESAQRLTVPARGTVKQFAADWRGQARPGMPAPLTMDQTPRLTPRGELFGVIRHQLPATIRDAELIVVGPQFREAALRDLLTDQSETAQQSPPRAVIARTALGDWPADQPLDLGAINLRLTANLRPTLRLDTPEARVGDTLLFNASFIGALRQPNYRNTGRDRDGPGDAFTARIAQDLDLARWTTQPAIIVIGRLDDDELNDADAQRTLFAVPGPGGDPRPLPVAEGLTIIRWIAPLDPAPVDFAGRR